LNPLLRKDQWNEAFAVSESVPYKEGHAFRGTDPNIQMKLQNAPVLISGKGDRARREPFALSPSHRTGLDVASHFLYRGIRVTD
jgi:hypothetical protein